MQTTDIKVEFKNSLMYHSKEQAPEFISEREREREREREVTLFVASSIAKLSCNSLQVNS